MRTFRRRLTGMLAAVLMVGILIGLPVILVEIGGNPLPDQLPSLSDVGKALTSPDDGTLAVAAISLIAWAAWLILAGSHPVRRHVSAAGHHRAALPGLRLPQLAARSLVTAALLLFAATPQQRPASRRPGSPTRGHRRPQPRPGRDPTRSHRRAHANGRRKPWRGRVGDRPLSGAERGLAVDDRP